MRLLIIVTLALAASVALGAPAEKCEVNREEKDLLIQNPQNTWQSCVEKWLKKPTDFSYRSLFSTKGMKIEYSYPELIVSTNDGDYRTMHLNLSNGIVMSQPAKFDGERYVSPAVGSEKTVLDCRDEGIKNHRKECLDKVQYSYMYENVVYVIKKAQRKIRTKMNEEGERLPDDKDVQSCFSANVPMAIKNGCKLQALNCAVRVARVMQQRVCERKKNFDKLWADAPLKPVESLTGDDKRIPANSTNH